MDPLCSLRAPEDKIIILGSVKLLPEAPHLLQKLLLYNKQMADIIHTGKQIPIKCQA